MSDIYCPYCEAESDHDFYDLMSCIEISDEHWSAYEEVECEQCGKYFAIELSGAIQCIVSEVGQ